MRIGLVLLPAILCAAAERFPVVGGSQFQTVAIRITALGTKDTQCTASLSFRSLSGEQLGETKVVTLRIGESQKHTLPFSQLGLGNGERAEVRPVVELGSPLSVCWPAVEVAEAFGGSVPGYLSGTTLRMKRPIDAKLSPFVDVKEREALRVLVYRVDGESAPACELNAGLRKADGSPQGEEQAWTLAPGEAKQIDYSPAGDERVLINLRPVREGTAAGCVAAAQLYDRRSGSTLKVVPMALPLTPELLAVPPAPGSAAEPQPEELPSNARPIGVAMDIASPLGLPPVSIPEDNPPTDETVALGRRLFYDTLFSADGTLACASCHDPAAGFSDPRPRSLGVNGADGDRHSMSVVNAAFSPEVFWEGRAKGLEAQARMPVPAANEFALSLQGVERRLQADPVYVRLFEAAWGKEPISYDMVAKSIASFQRTLLSGNAPIDRFLFGGDRNALSQSAQRGLNNFQGLPGCNQCHLIGTRSATFGNDAFFNTGIAALTNRTLSDQGRWNVTQAESDRGAFRPPSLRNIELRAPYMHNGSRASIADVLFFYAGGGRDNTWLSPILRAIGRAPGGIIPPADVEDFNNFVAALTGQMPERAGPPDE